MASLIEVKMARSRQAARQRMRARSILASHYDAAGTSRRTHGWRRLGGGPNEIGDASLQRLRDVSRDLVRNNGHAQSALQVIQDDVVGRGIRPLTPHGPWKEWAESEAVDPDGRSNLHGITQSVVRAIAQDGEVLIRRRRRRLSDGLPLPLQLQVLEADHLDSSRHQTLPNGGRIIRGVEYNPIGQREAYWLHRDHPGSSLAMNVGSVRVPATDIAHVFREERPGQVRGVTWFAPCLLRFKDFDDLTDAKLMQQRVAALFGVIVRRAGGSSRPVGTIDSEHDDWEVLEPGSLQYLNDIEEGIETVSPPSVRDFPEYATMTQGEISAGLGVAYEDMTGDYRRLPFSAARASRLRHFGRVVGWRYRMVVPQFLNPVWTWAMQASVLAGYDTPSGSTEWTAPGLPMLDPQKEGQGVLMALRVGITTLEDEIQARGYNLDEFYDRIQRSNEELDRRGIVLDSDPRRMTQQGQMHKDTEPGRPSEDDAAAIEQAMTPVATWLGSLPPDIAEQVFDIAGDYLEEAA